MEYHHPFFDAAFDQNVVDAMSAYIQSIDERLAVAQSKQTTRKQTMQIARLINYGNLVRCCRAACLFQSLPPWQIWEFGMHMDEMVKCWNRIGFTDEPLPALTIPKGMIAAVEALKRVDIDDE
jgi:hypothetical protein